MIRVLLCDDHALVRQAIAQVLADAGDIVLAAEAQTGPEAIGLVRVAAEADPIHVVLMDISMPHRDGLDSLRQLRIEFPRLPVLMLSTYPDKQYAVRSLKLGAAGYLNKSADAEQMTGAIRHVVAGGRFITPAIAVQLVGAIGHAGDPDAPPQDRLTQREYQVFHLLAGGRSIGEIAEQMVLPPAVVSGYRARILQKTGARNDVELALCTVRAELMPL